MSANIFRSAQRWVGQLTFCVASQHWTLPLQAPPTNIDVSWQSSGFGSRDVRLTETQESTFKSEDSNVIFGVAAGLHLVLAALIAIAWRWWRWGWWGLRRRGVVWRRSDHGDRGQESEDGGWMHSELQFGGDAFGVSLKWEEFVGACYCLWCFQVDESRGSDCWGRFWDTYNSGSFVSRPYEWAVSAITARLNDLHMSWTEMILHWDFFYVAFHDQTLDEEQISSNNPFEVERMRSWTNTCSKIAHHPQKFSVESFRTMGGGKWIRLV